MRADKEAALRLIEYFDHEAPKRFPYVVRAEAEHDSGGWQSEPARDRYLRSYVEMASAGLFSYDTPTSGSNTDYFMVAYPQHPMKVNEIPVEIQELVNRIKLSFLFSKTPYIPEGDTLAW